MVERRPNQTKSPRRPFRYIDTGPHRSPGRLALLRALAAEYEFGNSVSKLYVRYWPALLWSKMPKLLRPRGIHDFDLARYKQFLWNVE